MQISCFSKPGYIYLSTPPPSKHVNKGKPTNMNMAWPVIHSDKNARHDIHVEVLETFHFHCAYTVKPIYKDYPRGLTNKM